MIPFLPGRRVGHVVDEQTGCWSWTGAHAPNGYARVGVGYRVLQAHVVYWERVNGPKPEGMDLDHLCRNRGCVNPEHLEPVTRFVNSIRGAKAKLSLATTAEIRDRYAQGGTTYRALGLAFGIHHTTVHDVVRGRRWRLISR